MKIFNRLSFFAQFRKKTDLEAEIKDRKLSEAALRQSEERYRTILDSMEDGYF